MPAVLEASGNAKDAAFSAPTPTHAKTTIVGLGDPVMDVLVPVSPQFLSSIAKQPGGCIPVNGDEMESLLQSCTQQHDPLRIPGGSAANVMKGLANMLSGEQAASVKFVGMVGSDSTGDEYREKLASQGVLPLLQRSSSGAPSATCLCLITPDGQRTMRTCLGASLELQAASMVPPGWSEGCRLLHCEGYCLYRPQLAADMMRGAKKAGSLVSMDLASFELVANCQKPLMDLLQEGLLDLVFANEEEAVALYRQLGGGGGGDAHPVPDNGVEEADGLRQVRAAQEFLLRYCQVSVVSLGARGCVVRSRDGGYGMAPACLVEVKDTIGAGDYFTSGFLFAYLQGASLQQCAVCGCAAGAEAVQTTGAELSAESYERLRRDVRRAIAV